MLETALLMVNLGSCTTVTDTVSPDVTPWLETHRDGPFFVFLHVFDPHDPYEPSAPYNSMWSDAAKKEEHQRQEPNDHVPSSSES